MAEKLNSELLKKAKQIHIRSKHLVDSAVVGSYHSAFRGKGMEFQEVRQYTPGDDIRDIDWNVTARLGEPYIKVFKEERELNVMLLIDLSASGNVGSFGQIKKDFITEVAAILAFSAIKNNDNVGLILFSDHVELFLPAKKGRGHAWRVIRETLNFQSQGKKTNLAVAIDFLNRVMRRRGVCFLISDFVDNDRYFEPLTIAAKRHDFVSVVVRDTLEDQLAASGIVTLEDPETNRRVYFDGQSPRVRQNLHELVEQENSRLLTKLRKVGSPCWFANSAEDSLKQLVGFFRRREK